MPKSARVDPAKVAAEVESMQQELKALQEALGELVDAMITEGKPEFGEIKKLKTLKQKALDEGPAKRKTKAKSGKTEKPPAQKRP
jgi:hypothetical protein